MKKLLITCIIAATGSLAVVPGDAYAAGYGAMLTCVPSTRQNPTCDDKQDVFRRLYELEVKYEAQQERIVQLEARMEARGGFTAAGGTGVEARVAVLEERFTGLQSLLLQVVAMLTQLIAKMH